MTALIADRNTPRLEGDFKLLPMAAAAKIFLGAIVMRDASGNAVKGQTALGLYGAGVAIEQIDNSAGNAGDKSIRVREGIFRFANSASTDQITNADIGTLCYAVDDQTVAKTAGSGTRSVAGIVMNVDTIGVHVLFSQELLATYRKSRRMFVPVRVATLAGANVYRQLSIHSGRVVKIWSVIEGALTTGDAILTAKIAGVAITNGVLTHVQSGSAAGNTATAVPTALNVVAVGDELSLTVSGSQASATVANALFEIERD